MIDCDDFVIRLSNTCDVMGMYYRNTLVVM